MSTALVRMNKRSHLVLQKLAKRQKASMAAILDAAIEQYRRRNFLEALNSDFAELRKSPAQWRHEQHERAAWDTTLADNSDRRAKVRK